MPQTQTQTQAQQAYEETLRAAAPNVTGNVWSDLIINELCYEDQVSDAILALLILKQFEQSTTGSSQEESTEDGQTQPTPDPRRDILSRKRARSPPRESTPCPGANREAIALAHARKRLCTPQNFAPTALMTEATTPTATTPTSSNVFQSSYLPTSNRGPFASPEMQFIAPRIQPVAPGVHPMAAPLGMASGTAVGAVKTPMTGLPQHPQQPPFPRGFRPTPICNKAMRDVKARMTGHATEAHISSVCKKFLQYPKLPIAYIAVCDDSKLELFWMFAGDMGPLQQRVLENCEPPLNLYEKGILKLRMGPRAAPRPATNLQHNSVLQTHHIKEIDGRPRPTLQDRVKMWLANVSGP